MQSIHYIPLDSCMITGKSNYTLYVPIGSSFSVNASYTCTPPDKVKVVIWFLENAILGAVYGVNTDFSFVLDDRPGFEAVCTPSWCELMVRNATMEYHGNLKARIRPGGRNRTDDKFYPQHIFIVKVIVTGIILILLSPIQNKRSLGSPIY